MAKFLSKQKEDNYFERMSKRKVTMKVCPKCLDPFVVVTHTRYGFCANCSQDMKAVKK